MVELAEGAAPHADLSIADRLGDHHREVVLSMMGSDAVDTPWLHSARNDSAIDELVFHFLVPNPAMPHATPFPLL